MSFNTSIINTKTINGSGVQATGSGSLVDVEQAVMNVGSGSLGGIEQIVTLLETGSGTLVALEQIVQTVAAGTLVSIGQNVRDTTESSRLSRRGHDVAVFIGGYKVPDDDLTDEMSIVFNEDAAASCDFTIRPTIGTQDISFYYGKSVAVNVTKSNNTVHRAFTGIVDVVDFDIITNKTQLTCTDRRRELMDNISGPLAVFGQYDTTLLENYANNSNSQIIDKLLPYRPYSLDFDSYNGWHYTSWTPKATADITLSDSSVFRRDPSIELINRGRIVNKINLDVTYTFKRLHHFNASYSWGASFQSNGTGFYEHVLKGGETLAMRSTIEAAVSGTGWPLKSPIVYSGLPVPGWYGLSSPVAWVGDSIRSGTTAVVESSPFGSQAVITDSNGNTVKARTNKQLYDIAGNHASSAGWVLTNRWSQDVTHKHVLSISSSTSTAIFGEVSQDSSYSFSDAYDTSRWDSFDEYENSFDVGDGTEIAMGSSGERDVQGQLGLSTSNIYSAIEKARTEILSSHRDNRVAIETDIIPEVQLFHTVHVNATKIDAKGKVKTYTHTIDFKEPCNTHTNIEIAFYALGAGGSDTTLSLNDISDSPVGEVVVPSLGSRRPNTDTINNDTGSYLSSGFHANRFEQNGFSSKTYSKRPVQFIVDSPSVPATLTDGYEYTGVQNYSTSIPVSTITITYDEKC